jgi:hypothetical protein
MIWHELTWMTWIFRNYMADLLKILPWLSKSLPSQLQMLSAGSQASSCTAKTAKLIFLTFVYNHFFCSLSYANGHFYYRKLVYLLGCLNSFLCWFLNLMVLFNVHIVMKMIKRMIVQNDSIGGHRNIITGKYAGFFVPPPLPSYCYLFIGTEFVVRLF